MGNTSVQRPSRARLRMALAALCGTIVVVASFVLWRGSGGGAATGYGPPKVLGHVEYAEVDESSGLVASHQNPGQLWTLNSDPQDQFIYCLEPDGEHCGVWRVPVAQEGDWEGLAIGPGPEPDKPYLYIGDIGSNSESRTEVLIYRVVEPDVMPGEDSSTEDEPLKTKPVEEFQLVYPDGPHDAETLMVHPKSGDIYLVTKNDGLASVYKAAAPGDSQDVVALVLVARIRSERITDGSISPTGRRVILCTSTLSYELVLPPGASFDLIWQQELDPVSMVPNEDREACTYRLDGKAILTTSEGERTPIYEVGLEG